MGEFELGSSISRRRSAHRLASAAVLAFAATVGSAAHAQSDADRGAARSAAEAGDAAFRAGRYQEAADYFERAEHLVHAPTLLLYMARSHAKLGHYVKAREAYIRITREVLPASAPAVFRGAQDSARAELPDVEAKIARVTISVDGPPRSALHLTFDGVAVSSDVVGLPYPVDPGKHQVQASADGYDPASADVAVKEAESGQVRLRLSPSATPAGPIAPPTAPESTAPPPGTPPPDQTVDTGPTSSDNGTMRIGAYVGLGVGAVGVGLGTLFLVQHFSKQSDADKKFDACNAKGCGSEEASIKSLDNDAASKGTLSIISYSVGAVGLATGITLLVLSGGSHKENATAIHPYFTGTGGGVVGRF